MSSLVNLGDDVWIEIFKFLGVKDISKTIQTCLSIYNSYLKHEVPILKNIVTLHLKLDSTQIGIERGRTNSIVDAYKKGFQMKSEYKAVDLKEIIFQYPQSYEKIPAGPQMTQCGVFLPKYPVLNASRFSKLTESEKEVYKFVTDANPYIFISIFGDKTFSLMHGPKTIRKFVGHKNNILDILPMIVDPFSTQISTVQKHIETSSLFNHRVASASSDSDIKIWSLETAKCLSTLPGHDQAVFSIKSIQNKLVSASGDCTVALWDLEKEQMLDKSKKHTKIVYHCHTDGNESVISSSKDGKIHLFSVGNNNLEWISEIQDNGVDTGPVYNADLSGYYFTTFSKDCIWRLWDLRKSFSQPMVSSEFKDDNICSSLYMNDRYVFMTSPMNMKAKFYNISSGSWEKTIDIAHYPSEFKNSCSNFCKRGIYY